MKQKIKFEFYNEKLINYRKQAGLSQESLANDIEVSRQSIYSWESGKSIPDVENIIKLCKRLEITPDKLTNCFNLENNKKKKLKINVVIILLNIILLFFIIYIINSVYKAIVLNNIRNNLVNLENINNYYYKESMFKSKEMQQYDYKNLEVFYKDGVLKMILTSGIDNSGFWIDYNNEEGYSFYNNIYEKINMDELLLPKQNGLRLISTSLVDNEHIINLIYSFNPFLTINTRKDRYILKHTIKVSNYKGKVEEHINKKDGTIISKIEYGNNGIDNYSLFEVKINSVNENQIKKPSFIIN